MLALVLLLLLVVVGVVVGLVDAGVGVGVGAGAGAGAGAGVAVTSAVVCCPLKIYCVRHVLCVFITRFSKPWHRFSARGCR